VLRQAGYETSQVHEIANMAFVSGDTNRRLSNKPPAEYFPDVIKRRGVEALERQSIPLDRALHEVENYPKFLEARRERLATEINRFINRALEAS